MRINFRWSVHDARMFGWAGADSGTGTAHGDTQAAVRKDISRQVPYGCVSSIHPRDNTPEDLDVFFKW